MPTDLVDDLVESRDWWRDEALRIERDFERALLVVGIFGIAVAVAAFWVGVMIG